MEPSGERVLTVGRVSHHSIELVWSSEHGTRWTEDPESWTCFSLEQKNAKKNTYREIHKSFHTHFTVDNLEPKTSYTFRLKVTWPSGHQLYYPTVLASTEKEPLNGKDLHKAVLRNDELKLRQVLQSRSVPVDVPDSLDFTPLMVATKNGFISGVEILVHHGADVNEKNSSGKDSLMLACFHGHLDVVKFLLGRGASWSARDRSSFCALHWATVGGHLPVLQHLIQDGCEVDVRDCNAWTPLMIVSVLTGETAVASLLISAGADVNTQDKYWKTPLMVAVLNNYEPLVKLLLENGADPHFQNKSGFTAVDMARAFQRERITHLLLSPDIALNKTKHKSLS